MTSTRKQFQPKQSQLFSRVGIGWMLALILMIGTLPLFAKDPVVGKKAPTFGFIDAKEAKRSLFEFRGKLVVLEWADFSCSMVNKYYEAGILPALQREVRRKGGVWITVVPTSSQGASTPVELERMVRSKKSAASAVAVDFNKKISKLYGTRVTPQICIINPKGKLVYRGAIDDSREVKDKSGGNFVDLGSDSGSFAEDEEVIEDDPFAVVKEGDSGNNKRDQGGNSQDIVVFETPKNPGAKPTGTAGLLEGGNAYVREALQELFTGQKVSIPETKARGCPIRK